MKTVSRRFCNIAVLKWEGLFLLFDLPFKNLRKFHQISGNEDAFYLKKSRGRNMGVAMGAMG